jgi:signal transduction histidine kinase
MNVKLLQAERLAAVGQLAAGAAHEINNPLSIIYARAQLLEQKEDDPGRKKSLRQMLDQMERITAILTSLMDFARPARPAFAATDLAAVVERSLDLVAGGLERQGIELDLEVAPDLPLIRGDARQLEQVFLNLLINSEHAMEESGGRLAVRLSRADAQGFAQVVLADTGCGIAPENLPRIFDPFFTTKEEGRGTGLGLSTSYGIIQGHSGEIRVASEPDRGTEVTILLPLAPAAGARDKNPSEEER